MFLWTLSGSFVTERKNSAVLLLFPSVLCLLFMGCIRDSYTLVLPERQHGLIWLQKMLMLTKIFLASLLHGLDQIPSLPACLALASSPFGSINFPPLLLHRLRKV